MKSRYVPFALVPVILIMLITSSRPISSTIAASAANPVSHPFPQHTTYRKGIILPDHITRGQMDDKVRTFYRAWKKRYIRRGCGPGEYYVWFEGPDTRKQCVSEGQGYGMIIIALMAGYDTAAHTIYDGLLHYCRAHPSKADPHLMSWAQKKGCRNVDGSSATDGDMDIAYSLLLASAQWGNAGPVNYRKEALRMIQAILKEEINQQTFSILLSNSVEDDSEDYTDMRTSDFMPAHFRAFRAFSGDPSWDKVIANNYSLFRFLQDAYSPEAGLLPDFINKVTVGPAKNLSGPAASTYQTLSEDQTPLLVRAIPARSHYLESRYDGSYNYNACRVPWRIGTDFILNGDLRAAEIIEKINRWIRSTTKDNPDNISAGYSLGGADLKDRYYEAMCFIAPFAVGAMAGPNNQPWLNKLWDYMVHFPLEQFDYYDNSIKLIDMIILSGNYWAPTPGA